MKNFEQNFDYNEQMIPYISWIPISKVRFLYFILLESKQKHAVRKEFLRRYDHPHCGQLLSFDK